MKFVLLLLSLTVCVCFANPFSDDAAITYWGVSHDNSNNFAAETTLKPCNIQDLVFFCNISLDGPIETAYPAVFDNHVAFGDFGGNLYYYQINRYSQTCTRLWKVFLPDITGLQGTQNPILGFSGSMTRNTPILYYVHPHQLRITVGDFNSASVWTFDDSGNLIWNRTLDTNVFGRMASSGTYFDGKLFFGVDSKEEEAPLLTGNPFYQYTFRGSVAVLSAVDGTIIWQTYMCPKNYTGVGIWAGGVTLDLENNTVIVNTGNNYALPADVAACLNATGMASCVSPLNYEDAQVALDLTTGAVRWATSFNGSPLGIDPWNLNCLFGLPFPLSNLKWNLRTRCRLWATINTLQDEKKWS